MPKMTPEAEARYALDFNVARSDLSMPAQLAYDELVRDGYGTSKEEEASDAVFPALGVQVRGDTNAQATQIVQLWHAGLAAASASLNWMWRGRAPRRWLVPWPPSRASCRCRSP